jgi:hypothetical protein
MSGTIAQTTPYAWPYDGRFEGHRTALVVVSPSVGLAPADGDVRWCRTADLADAVAARGGVVVSVTTTPPPAETSTERTPHLGTTLVAAGVDGFYGSPLDAWLRLRGRDQLLLVGRGLETCVHSTMRSANDRGYECLLVLDATTPYDPSLEAAARSQIEMSGGIFGAVGLTEYVLKALEAA